MTINRSDTSFTGILLAGIMGMLSTFLLMTTWAVLTTVMAGLDTSVAIVPALVIGFILGIILGIFRQGKTSSLAFTVILGIIAGLVYLLLTSFQPIGLDNQHLFWGSILGIITLGFSSFLTRYSLRNIRLSELRRDVYDCYFPFLLHAYFKF